MSTIRKALPFLTVAVVALWTFFTMPPQPTVHAQQTSTAYDCNFTFSFTGTGVQTGVPNSATSRPCIAWRVTYSTTGFSTVTVQFETSPDNSSWTAVPNTICSATVQPPCLTDGANPLTAAKQGTAAIRAYGKFVRINITGVSGSGTGTVIVYGYKGTSASAGTGSGTGGATGPSGPSGPAGSAGATGATGPSGTGATGATGPSGTAGGSGPSGPSGPAGSTPNLAVAITDLGPVSGDSGLILVIDPHAAITLDRIWCAVQGSTNVVLNLDKRTEAAIGTDTGNHLLGSDLTAVSGGANTSTFSNSAGQCGGTGSCAIAAHAPVVMTFTSVSGSPTSLNCSVDYH